MRRLGAIHSVAKSRGFRLSCHTCRPGEQTQQWRFLILVSLSRCFPHARGCDFSLMHLVSGKPTAGLSAVEPALFGRCACPRLIADLDVPWVCWLGIKILVGTPVTCIEADDDTAWSYLQSTRIAGLLLQLHTSPKMIVAGPSVGNFGKICRSVECH